MARAPFQERFQAHCHKTCGFAADRLTHKQPVPAVEPVVVAHVFRQPRNQTARDLEFSRRKKSYGNIVHRGTVDLKIPAVVWPVSYHVVPETGHQFINELSKFMPKSNSKDLGKRHHSIFSISITSTMPVSCVNIMTIVLKMRQPLRHSSRNTCASEFGRLTTEVFARGKLGDLKAELIFDLSFPLRTDQPSTLRLSAR